jgi:hypothetical protein
MHLILRNHVSSIQRIYICNFPQRFCTEHPQAKHTELYTNNESLTIENVWWTPRRVLVNVFFSRSSLTRFDTKPYPNVISMLVRLNVLLHTCNNKEKRSAQFWRFLYSVEWWAPTRNFLFPPLPQRHYWTDGLTTTKPCRI